MDSWLPKEKVGIWYWAILQETVFIVEPNHNENDEVLFSDLHRIGPKAVTLLVLLIDLVLNSPKQRMWVYHLS